MTRDEFVTKWALGFRDFEVDLDALIEWVRAEEREAVLSDGDALRDALRGQRW